MATTTITAVQAHAIKHWMVLRPSYAAYLWSLALSFARQSMEPTAHQGDLWLANMTGRAESILDQCGVAWEVKAGERYINGARIWWSNRTGRWEQD
jgi:hypothetical protein